MTLKQQQSISSVLGWLASEWTPSFCHQFDSPAASSLLDMDLDAFTSTVTKVIVHIDSLLLVKLHKRFLAFFQTNKPLCPLPG